MEIITLNNILIASGAILMSWIFNNVKLREGITEWTVGKFTNSSYKINDHNVLESLKNLRQDTLLNKYNNDLKTNVYHFYTSIFLNNMSILVNEILEKQKTLNFEETKKNIKNLMIDKLEFINQEINNKIDMPDILQKKFDRLNKYLTMQHKFAIEHALQAPNKKILLLQVLDAIDNNNRWFIFYCNEMFENFNGGFDNLKKKDVFKF